MPKPSTVLARAAASLAERYAAIPPELRVMSAIELVAQAAIFQGMRWGAAKPVVGLAQSVVASKNPYLERAASRMMAPFAMPFVAGLTMLDGIQKCREKFNGGTGVIADLVDAEGSQYDPNVVSNTLKSIALLAAEFRKELLHPLPGQPRIAAAIKVMSLGDPAILTTISKKLEATYKDHAVLTPQEESHFVDNVLSVAERQELANTQTRFNEICARLKEAGVEGVVDKELRTQNRIIDFVTARAVAEGHAGQLMLTAQSIRTESEMLREYNDMKRIAESAAGNLSIKIVAGAYVGPDRAEDPTCVPATAEETHSNYRKQLVRYATLPLTSVVAATHNGDNLGCAYGIYAENAPTSGKVRPLGHRANLMSLYPRQDNQPSDRYAKATNAMPASEYIAMLSAHDPDIGSRTLLRMLAHGYPSRRLFELAQGPSGQFGFDIRKAALALQAETWCVRILRGSNGLKKEGLAPRGSF